MERELSEWRTPRVQCSPVVEVDSISRKTGEVNVEVSVSDAPFARSQGGRALTSFRSQELQSYHNALIAECRDAVCPALPIIPSSPEEDSKLQDEVVRFLTRVLEHPTLGRSQTTFQFFNVEGHYRYELAASLSAVPTSFTTFLLSIFTAFPFFSPTLPSAASLSSVSSTTMNLLSSSSSSATDKEFDPFFLTLHKSLSDLPSSFENVSRTSTVVAKHTKLLARNLRSMALIFATLSQEPRGGKSTSATDAIFPRLFGKTKKSLGSIYSVIDKQSDFQHSTFTEMRVYHSNAARNALEVLVHRAETVLEYDTASRLVAQCVAEAERLKASHEIAPERAARAIQALDEAKRIEREKAETFTRVGIGGREEMARFAGYHSADIIASLERFATQQIHFNRAVLKNCEGALHHLARITFASSLDGFSPESALSREDSILSAPGWSISSLPEIAATLTDVFGGSLAVEEHGHA
ncbi:hypothetical protein M427DRAFT_69720 [Gonapodya prolifera JEL478]|uniref:PX domain-containing protein n=1 Tax=Gonapodya prolifera (strain JEL478) TaxID=1344416 RepID=A0A139AG80_GONPJ|nr:hypothetical protein M427DRAFT_69720 [Gonapodya prolifera JEL478]|eukprot:KXS15797.1 hypothetical protein M427DRAFT_69720 [Gonapodya prolifera JEL478]